MKILTNIIVGIIVGGLGVYFTLDWQEENLVYSITAPAKFGDINYQNITIENTGWNPAINVNLYIDHPNIKFVNTQSKTTIKDISSETNGIASIERIRRDESIIVSLAYEGQPLFGTEIKISSDRSIAIQTESESKDYLSSWAEIVLAVIASFFTISIFSAVIIPATKSYKETKARLKEKNKIIDDDL